MEDRQGQPGDELLSEKSKGQSQQEDEAAKRARIRAKVITEIMESEKTYQRHLELVIQYFEGPLRDLNLVPDHVIVTIFSNVRQLVSVNQELVEHLTQTSVGQAFLRMGPFFKLYSTYANNHERALAAMIEWEQKRPDFGAWRRRQEDIPEMMGLKLNSLLITPVQRVPRYKLLLEDLMSNTNKTHEDYSAIEESVKQISAVASHINEHIRQHDNFNKMLAIQKSLAGPGAPRILTPGRIFIKDGPLKKVSKKGGRSHERMFFLFSDILLYAKPKLVDQMLSGSYVTCCVFPLHHCRVDTVFGHSESSGSLFTITCKNESLLLYSDQKSVQAWVTVLRKAIESLQDCRQTLRKPSSALQPLRRPGLVQLRKQQKKKDPLENAKRTPDRISQSPRSIKRALAEANINCLTPRKQQKTSYPTKDLRRALSPVFSGSDIDESPHHGSLQSEKKKKHCSSNVVSEPQSESRQRRMAKKLMTHIRHIGGKPREKVIAEKAAKNTIPYAISPEPKKQGPDCDIEEILDPDRPKWDIFDTAPPDTSVVWRSRLDTDTSDLQCPVAPPRRTRAISVSDNSVHRPHSEISENTSRIWKARPDSEVSDDFEESSNTETYPSMKYSDMESPHEGLSRVKRKVQHNADSDGDYMTIYSPSSRDFLSRYAFDEDGSPRPMIYHKQSESMLMPWRTQWQTPSPTSERDVAACSGDTVLSDPDFETDGVTSLKQLEAAYPQSDCSTPPGLCYIEENHDYSPECDRYATDYHHPPTCATPQKDIKYKAELTPWKLLDRTGEAAERVFQSPVLYNGNACCLQ